MFLKSGSLFIEPVNVSVYSDAHDAWTLIQLHRLTPQSAKIMYYLISTLYLSQINILSIIFVPSSMMVWLLSHNHASGVTAGQQCIRSGQAEMLEPVKVGFWTKTDHFMM